LDEGYAATVQPTYRQDHGETVQSMQSGEQDRPISPFVTSSQHRASSLQFEKRRAAARMLLTGGEHREGCVFVAGSSAWHDGPERVGELLHEHEGFLPFELQTETGPRIVLINPDHILMVELAEDESRSDAGYVVARRQPVSVLMASGQRITGAVRVHRPEGQDRLSDWSRQPGRFRYIETTGGALLLNASHIVELSEVSE
jgi:hypothetical protein